MNNAHRIRQAGFTLVELMISMTLGLLIVLALVTLLVNVNRNNSEMSKTNRIIENGRFALQLLQADVTHGGYLGGFVPEYDDWTRTTLPTDAPTAVPDPCRDWVGEPWDAAYRRNLVGIPVQGYEIPATVPSPTLPVCAARVVSPQPSTDVLLVRHAETCVPGEGDCPAVQANHLYFQTSRCDSDATPYVLDATVLNSTAFDPAVFALKQKNCTSTMEVRKFVSNLYYVRSYAVTPGDGIPTLMRSKFGYDDSKPQHEPAQALIEGVEGFRVEYGIDNLSDTGASVNFAQTVTWANPAVLTQPTNRGDGIPDGVYVRCTSAMPCTVDQLMNVVAVRVHVLMRSERTTGGYTDSKTYNLGTTTMGPFNDGYKRHVFTQTMRLVNMSGRRETP